jgi:hypothetical protein
MNRPHTRSVVLAAELLEDRITPTISFGAIYGAYIPGSNAQAMTVGDLNGDGKLDIVISTFTKGVERRFPRNESR